jgi:hypothetical protein
MALLLFCPTEGGSLASHAFAAEPSPALTESEYAVEETGENTGTEGAATENAPPVTLATKADYEQSADTYEGAELGSVDETDPMDAPGAASATEALHLSLSEPTLSDAPDGRKRYTTTLTVEGISAFYGYQIQVAAPSEDAVALNNLVNGTVTESVFRDGSVFLAVLASEKMSGNLAICEIVSDFSPGDTERERTITVTQAEVVTSIASEAFLTLGPNPAAAVLALPSAGLAGLSLWVVVLGLIALVLAVVVAVAVVAARRRHKSRGLHAGRRKITTPFAARSARHSTTGGL